MLACGVRRGGERLHLAAVGLEDGWRQGEWKPSFKDGVKGDCDRPAVVRGGCLDGAVLQALLPPNPHTSMEKYS